MNIISFICVILSIISIGVIVIFETISAQQMAAGSIGSVSTDGSDTNESSNHTETYTLGLPEESSVLPSKFNTSSPGKMESFGVEAVENDPVLLFSDSIIGQFPAFTSPSFAVINASGLLDVEIVNGSTFSNEVLTYAVNKSTTTISGQSVVYLPEGQLS
jgi:hypothetical protein